MTGNDSFQFFTRFSAAPCHLTRGFFGDPDGIPRHLRIRSKACTISLLHPHQMTLPQRVACGVLLASAALGTIALSRSLTADSLDQSAVFTATQTAGGITIPAMTHTFLKCPDGTHTTIADSGVTKAIRFWAYEYTGTEPPFRGKFFISAAELGVHPVYAMLNTLTDLAGGRLYYFMSEKALHFRCGEGVNVTARCGNGVREGAETCDDANTADGDGCSSTCSFEMGYACDGAPSNCHLLIPSLSASSDGTSTSSSSSSAPWDCPHFACPQFLVYGCQYSAPPNDAHGCPANCGTVVCPSSASSSSSPALSSSSSAAVCPMPSCPAAPPGCHYSDPPRDQRGCPTGCGKLLCSSAQSSSPGATSSLAGYPVTYKKLSAAEIDQRKQAFLQNDGHQWDHVWIDNWGFIDNAKTYDPDLIGADQTMTDADKAQWTAFFRKNADFFGIDDPQNFTLSTIPTSPDAFQSPQQQIAGGYEMGGAPTYCCYDGQAPMTVAKYPLDGSSGPSGWTTRLNVFVGQHWWPHAALPSRPQVSKDAIEAQVIGQTYTYTKDRCYPDGTYERLQQEAQTRSSCDSAVRTGVIHKGDMTITLGPRFRTNPTTDDLELRLAFSVTPPSLPNMSLIERTFDAITGEEFVPY